VLALDAFTRCWVQEGVLYDALRPLVSEDRRDLLDGLLAAWRSERLAALAASAAALADLLAAAITDAEPLAGSGRRELRRAADALARRLAESVAAANERLIALHGLEGEAAEALRVEISDVTAPAQAQVWQRSFWGGVVGGALGGLAADVATGGLSLGGGALLGALLGAAGGRGLAYGMELLRADSAPRTAWSGAFLERFATDALLRYLAVAHFGRGAGSYRVRDHPAVFRAAAEGARLRQAEIALVVAAFRGAGSGARGETARRLAPALDAALREILAELYPEAGAWLAAP
jgi:hypothetical protein